MLTLNSRVMVADSVPGLTSRDDRRLVLFLKTKKWIDTSVRKSEAKFCSRLGIKKQ